MARFVDDDDIHTPYKAPSCNPSVKVQHTLSHLKLLVLDRTYCQIMYIINNKNFKIRKNSHSKSDILLKFKSSSFS